MLKALLIDLDGVIYQAAQPVPGAIQALEWLDSQSIPYLFVTNTTSRPRDAIVARLAEMGIQVKARQILTPVIALANWIHQQDAEPLALFIPGDTRKDLHEFRQVPEDAESGAGTVVVGDLAQGWSFEVLNRAFRLLLSNPECQLVALGMTRYWRTESGLQLDVGPFVKALEYASDRPAQVFGKPAEAFFCQALDILAVRAEETLMIGDDIRGDVGGAQTSGLKGALVKTGKFQKSDLGGDIVPDVVLESFASLPEYWMAQH